MERIPSYSLTQAGKNDMPSIAWMHTRMLAECGIEEGAIAEGAEGLLPPWYEKEYGRGTMIHFLAQTPDKKTVAMAGALIKEDFPDRFFKPGYYGCIFDVYTAPAHRNNGLASRLVFQAQRWLAGKGAYQAKIAALNNRSAWFFEKLGYLGTREASLSLTNLVDFDEFQFDSAKL